MGSKSGSPRTNDWMLLSEQVNGCNRAIALKTEPSTSSGRCYAGVLHVADDGFTIFRTRGPGVMRSGRLGIRARSNGDDKISRGRRADILNAVLVVGMNKSYGARPHHMTCAIDRELDRTFPNEPHFAVHVVMRGVRHSARGQCGFVYFQRLASGQFPL